MKKVLLDLLDREPKKIATFCMISFVSAVLLFSPQVDNVVRLSLVGLYLLYALSFIFKNIKLIVSHCLGFLILVVFSAFLTTYAYNNYRLDLGTILVPSVLASYFGSWFIIFVTDTKRLQWVLSILPGIVFFLVSSIMIVTLKTTMPVLYIAAELTILFLEWFLLILFGKNLKIKENKE